MHLPAALAHVKPPHRAPTIPMSTTPREHLRSGECEGRIECAGRAGISFLDYFWGVAIGEESGRNTVRSNDHSEPNHATAGWGVVNLVFEMTRRFGALAAPNSNQAHP